MRSAMAARRGSIGRPRKPPGIDPAQAERLFDPFVRGDPSRNRATGGTGLGLAIARAIVARHEGQVSLANRDSGGAIATVNLPLALGR